MNGNNDAIHQNVKGVMNIERKVSKFIYWMPRVVSILFIIFLVMFSLDVFTPGATAKDIIIGLFMHNIPSLILVVVLIISWKYEIVGGIVFILAGLVYIIMVAIRQPWPLVLTWSLIIAGPAFFIGILFMITWFKKKD